MMGVSQADSVIEQWRERVHGGRLVGKFGDRVSALARSVSEAFMQRTLGSLVVRDRADRLAQLTNYIGVAAKTLFNQQMAIVSADTTRRFQRDLLKLLSSGIQSSEEEQQLLRQALFAYQSAATDLEVELFSLRAEALQAELAEDLKRLVVDFPESPAAKLLSLKRVEKEVRRPRIKKGSRAVNIGLSLVGMFRPPGFGSLQGFAGYSTALFGLPFDILMGVQNDGDSAEVGQDVLDFILLVLTLTYLDHGRRSRAPHFKAAA
jgi:hypothetical protein